MKDKHGPAGNNFTSNSPATRSPHTQVLDGSSGSKAGVSMASGKESRSYQGVPSSLLEDCPQENAGGAKGGILEDKCSVPGGSPCLMPMRGPVGVIIGAFFRPSAVKRSDPVSQAVGFGGAPGKCQKPPPAYQGVPPRLSPSLSGEGGRIRLVEFQPIPQYEQHTNVTNLKSQADAYGTQQQPSPMEAIHSKKQPKKGLYEAAFKPSCTPRKEPERKSASHLWNSSAASNQSNIEAVAVEDGQPTEQNNSVCEAVGFGGAPGHGQKPPPAEQDVPLRLSLGKGGRTRLVPLQLTHHGEKDSDMNHFQAKVEGIQTNSGISQQPNAMAMELPALLRPHIKWPTKRVIQEKPGSSPTTVSQQVIREEPGSLLVPISRRAIQEEPGFSSGKECDLHADQATLVSKHETHQQASSTHSRAPRTGEEATKTCQRSSPGVIQRGDKRRLVRFHESPLLSKVTDVPLNQPQDDEQVQVVRVYKDVNEPSEGRWAHCQSAAVAKDAAIAEGQSTPFKSALDGNKNLSGQAPRLSQAGGLKRSVLFQLNKSKNSAYCFPIAKLQELHGSSTKQLESGNMADLGSGVQFSRNEASQGEEGILSLVNSEAVNPKLIHQEPFMHFKHKEKNLADLSAHLAFPTLTYTMPDEGLHFDFMLFTQLQGPFYNVAKVRSLAVSENGSPCVTDNQGEAADYTVRKVSSAPQQPFPPQSTSTAQNGEGGRRKSDLQPKSPSIHCFTILGTGTASSSHQPWSSGREGVEAPNSVCQGQPPRLSEAGGLPRLVAFQFHHHEGQDSDTKTKLQAFVRLPAPSAKGIGTWREKNAAQGAFKESGSLRQAAIMLSHMKPARGKNSIKLSPPRKRPKGLGAKGKARAGPMPRPKKILRWTPYVKRGPLKRVEAVVRFSLNQQPCLRIASCWMLLIDSHCILKMMLRRFSTRIVC